jgi:dephospho-CoA kinase
VKVIGITGNLGCGKSTVAGMLRHRSVATIDADEVSREVRQTDEMARAAILARFGTLDATGIAAQVFGEDDGMALHDLEEIIHPRVRDRVRARLAELAEGGVGVAAVEAIKLLESPLHDACDETWVVVCDEEEARRRLVEDRGMSEADISARLARQSPQAVKVAAADVVIDGSATLAETERQVSEALDRLKAAT